MSYCNDDACDLNIKGVSSQNIRKIKEFDISLFKAPHICGNKMNKVY